jgi:hypothetical protein
LRIEHDKRTAASVQKGIFQSFQIIRRGVSTMSLLTTKTITAQNTWSDAVTLVGDFTLSISGTFAATVTVQRSHDNGVSWRDVDTFNSATEENGYEPEYVKYRVGVATGDFTSGSVVVRLGKGDTEDH